MRTPETSDIFIASSSFDKPTWQPVASELTEAGYEVCVFEADRVALGSTSLDVKVNNEEGLIVSYDDVELCVDSIKAAWYRRTSFIADSAQDATRQLGIDTERKAALGAIWSEVPDKKWINSPDLMLKAGRKITQLTSAHRVGFNIPTTVVTNGWDTIQRDLPSSIIYKSSYPLLYSADEVLSVFTTPYDNLIESLPTESNPYPGIWQERIAKKREWRITVVGDDFFDAAIYTSEDAKDDWRKHQNTKGRVSFKHERFPDDEKERCLEYLTHFGLNFGAFDFIENQDGEIKFLECNPNGQYMWIQELLKLPISSAIVSKLIKIANT